MRLPKPQSQCAMQNTFLYQSLPTAAGSRKTPLIVLLVLLYIQSDLVVLSSGPWAHMSHPCVYDDHLVTDKNWHGYLANITIMTTGRLTFEFTYPADKCCQNVLFYSEDQVATVNARMNCWQKEYLLRPEEDQILRLTPRFSWSGCHMTHPNDIATYVCKGGRSFTVDQPGERPTTWYIAASNCATLQGLDLQYRMEVFGHIGECRSPYSEPATVAPPVIPPSPRAALFARDKVETVSVDSCILEGDVNTTASWYGFLVNMTLAAGGGFSFRFSFPYSMQPLSVILYNEDDITRLPTVTSCWQKEGLIPSPSVPDQIIDLGPRSSWNGCLSKNSTGGRNLTCQGERRYDKARRVFVAVSNCRSLVGLVLSYHLEVFGFENDLCSMSSLTGLDGRTLTFLIVTFLARFYLI